MPWSHSLLCAIHAFMELRVLIGLNIQNQRRLIGLTQEALALKAGVDRGYMGKIENARFAMSVDKLEQIAQALDIHPNVLVTEPE